MTEHQKWAVEDWLLHNQPEFVHHGSCVGADYEFHKISRHLNLKIKGHPPINTSLMVMLDFDEENGPKSYLIRNADIVNETELLIACPKEDSIQFKGGTWHTYHYANRRNKYIIIIWPDGTCMAYNSH